MVRLASLFYWSNLKNDVHIFIENCLVCQKTKFTSQASAGLLQPLPIPILVWNDLTTDFIVGLPNSRGNTVVMVVVDRLTKYAHFGSKAAHLFVDIAVKHHGFPFFVILDRDPIFMSQFWNKLFELSGTKLKHSTTYHPKLMTKLRW